MKRAGYLGVSLFLLLTLSVSALPAFGQAKPPQLRTQPEYNAYMATFNEKDPAKKAEFGEKFIAEFKDSDYINQGYTMTLGAYRDTKNWAKVIDIADRSAALPTADNKMKVYAYVNAMNAAQNMNDIDKIVAYGEKVLVIQPDELNTMITLSSIIAQKLPTDATAKKAAMEKASDLATKALATIQGMIAKADTATKPQLEQIEGNLHATMGLIAYNRQDFPKSIEEYDKALQRIPKDELAHYYLALDHQTLAARASRDYAAAVDEENKAKREKAEQPIIDELAAKSSGLQEDVKNARDKALDQFAITVAIGGQLTGQAKEALTNLWKTKNNDSTDGLDQFVAEKKAQLK